jgi:hypothetical protein
MKIFLVPPVFSERFVSVPLLECKTKTRGESHT